MTQQEFNTAVRAIEKMMKTHVEAEVRKWWREERNLIYVRTYTVPAHVRVRKPKRRRIQ